MLEQTEEGPAEAAELGGCTYGPGEGCSGVDQGRSGVVRTFAGEQQDVLMD